MLYYYHSDHVGSSTFLSDAYGKSYEFMLYLPYGEEMARQKVAGWATPYTFTGKEKDDLTGLQYFGARYYDSRISIWYGVDPMADHPNQVDKSPYVYAWNNPVKLNDPDGRCPICPYIVGAVSGAALDYGLQVATNLYKGKGASSFTDVDGKSILISAGAGATGVGLAKNAGKLFQFVKGGNKIDDVANVADDVVKNSSKYDDVTKSSRGKSSTPNKQTDVTKAEFEGNLEKSGFKKTVSKDGNANTYTKDGNRYSTRTKSRDYDGPSADYKKAGSDGTKPDLKIRLQKDNP